MEARQVLREDARRNVADESFTQMLERKWGKYLVGIDKGYDRKVSAILFENQADDLKKKKRGGILSESTLDGDVEGYTKYIFPLIRRVWPNLIANEIASVQPMTAPIGAIFFLEYLHGTKKGTVAKGSNVLDSFNESYSSDRIDSEVVGSGDGTTLVFATTAGFSPVLPASDLEIKGYAVVIKVDGVEVTRDGGLGTFNDTTQIDGTASTVVYATGAISLTFKVGQAPASGTDNITVEYRYQLEATADIPEFDITITSEPVQAITRKLKAKWSPEAADDLIAFHGIDAEEEIVANIARELALEIDREIIDDIRTAAIASGITATFDRPIPSTNISDEAHLKGLYAPTSRVSNEIHKQTLRAPANWIITDPDVVSILDVLPTFIPMDDKIYTGNYGIVKAGTLASRWMVFKDPFFLKRGGNNEMLVGLKGDVFYNTGYVYAPYIPLQVTPTFLDPDTTEVKKAMRTRYGKRLINQKFFGLVKVTNLT